MRTRIGRRARELAGAALSVRTGLRLVSLASVLTSLVVCGSDRAHASPTDGVTWHAARLLKRHLLEGDGADLRAAGGLIQRWQRGGASSDGLNFLHEFVPYLLVPEAERDYVIVDPLLRAALDELAARDGELAVILLDTQFFGRASTDVAGIESYARTLSACTLSSRVERQPPDQVIAFMGLAPGDRVLDVGAGPGFWTFRFAEAIGPDGRVTAIEISDHFIDFLERYIAAHAIGNVDVVRGKMNDISRPARAADHAWMSYMFVDIEFYYPLAFRRRLFGSIHRALRRGGHFTVCDANQGPRHVLDAHQMAERLAAYGFEIEALLPPDSPLAAANSCVKAIRP